MGSKVSGQKSRVRFKGEVLSTRTRQDSGGCSEGRGGSLGKKTAFVIARLSLCCISHNSVAALGLNGNPRGLPSDAPGTPAALLRSQECCTYTFK